MGVFEKSQEKSGNLTELKKHQILSVYIYQIYYIQKPPNGEKLIKNTLKSD